MPTATSMLIANTFHREPMAVPEANRPQATTYRADEKGHVEDKYEFDGQLHYKQSIYFSVPWNRQWWVTPQINVSFIMLSHLM